ncbi:hypothetical protein WISP_134158 [Willisornis vidua]|uniref:Uncharacterized protein n=1 Tax=Willisornis vidua TaxID=1566151 RepID=A0ABQ9CNY3_9PASS|nr:hypothetical protein WISP_134158 [Willisornis vidua]
MRLRERPRSEGEAGEESDSTATIRSQFYRTLLSQVPFSRADRPTRMPTHSRAATIPVGKPDMFLLPGCGETWQDGRVRPPALGTLNQPWGHILPWGHSVCPGGHPVCPGDTKHLSPGDLGMASSRAGTGGGLLV